jgi:hypothetical protein
MTVQPAGYPDPAEPPNRLRVSRYQVMYVVDGVQFSRTGLVLAGP